MVLTGQSSGAQATITNVRLLTDVHGALLGSYFITNPNNVNFPRFETGTKTLKFTSNENNELGAQTTAANNYVASGTWENIEETIVSTRNATVNITQVAQDDTTSRTVSTNWVTLWERQTGRRNLGDPLAQSFRVNEDENPAGVFLTKCDIFFRTKDDMDLPVVFSIRTMQNGVPTQTIVPLTEVSLNPNSVNISA